MHISALSEKFIKDPREAVKAGDVVKVKVMEVDIPRKRVGLSMRMSDTPGEKIDGARGARPGSAPRQSQNRSESSQPRKETATAAPSQQCHGLAVRQRQAVEETLMEIPAGLTQSAFSELIGCRLQRLEKALAEVALTLEPHLRNRGGKLHGGAIFSLVDITMGLACSSSHGFDQQSATIECKINYIRAVEDGDVLCTAV